MNKPKLILIGAGGHGKSCIDVIEQEGKYEIVGFLDLPEKIGQKIFSYSVIDGDIEAEAYHKQGYEFLITVGQIKNADLRKKIFEKLNILGAKMATVISPRAYVSKYATVEKGTIVMHNAFVNAGAKVGVNCILNSGCYIEHDALIGNHSHISTGAFINGDCKIGNETFIGSNATVSSQISVDDNVVVGAGSVVITNIGSNMAVAGVPAVKI